MDLSKYGVNLDNKILNIALTHSSYSAENGGECYERLEFLGDSVLGLIISEYFYKKSNMTEGEMSKIRASYVCESALFEYAQKACLIDNIKYGEGLKGTVCMAVVSDVFESVVACIYLNSGYNKAKEFVMDIAKEYIDSKHHFMNDYKSYLQELVQTDKKSVSYQLIKEVGPSHDKTFTIDVIVEGMVYGRGVGKTKKEAEQRAAQNAIEKKAGSV